MNIIWMMKEDEWGRGKGRKNRPNRSLNHVPEGDLLLSMVFLSISQPPTIFKLNSIWVLTLKMREEKLGLKIRF